jgi:hypothetical protein
MKESHRKGLANHPDPESCGGSRKTVIEALTGAHAGQPLSCEISPPECRRRRNVGRPRPVYRYREVYRDSAQSRDPEHAWKLHAREPGDPSAARSTAGRSAKI